ncbi:uncharacterized protein L201_001688 [Kwoniella dendrophila CBS 6074]|uniref:ASX DEUBAD domain-containing protein n=1 Tax=Kwoniella dendrophila CBS 6074 TaxID=1295534 RepID=A0AAX4JPJ1_9TREE
MSNNQLSELGSWDKMESGSDDEFVIVHNQPGIEHKDEVASVISNNDDPGANSCLSTGANTGAKADIATNTTDIDWESRFLKKEQAIRELISALPNKDDWSQELWDLYQRQPYRDLTGWSPADIATYRRLPQPFLSDVDVREKSNSNTQIERVVKYYRSTLLDDPNSYFSNDDDQIDPIVKKHQRLGRARAMIDGERDDEKFYDSCTDEEGTHWSAQDLYLDLPQKVKEKKEHKRRRPELYLDESE